jgi:hypothetical protein
MRDLRALLKRDLRAAPRAFFVSGPVDEEVLGAWLARQDREIPEDLLTLWRTIGGGELFETEELLVPGGVDIYVGEFAHLNADYDLDAQNTELRDRGMSSDFLVFHHGAGWLVAIDRVGAVVELDRATYEPVGGFASVEDWYRTVREALYGLETLPPE